MNTPPGNDRLLSASELPFVADVAFARSTLERYVARDAAQARARDTMLAFVARHPHDAHLRTCLEGHLTASALVVDALGERALLTFHKKLRRWLQLGGHCDGDANLAGAALREAREESGIDELAIDPEPIDLDVHAIPARPGEPEHLHLDARFVVRAPAHARATASEESLDLAWFTPDEVLELDTDDSVRRLFALAFARVR